MNFRNNPIMKFSPEEPREKPRATEEKFFPQKERVKTAFDSTVALKDEKTLLEKMRGRAREVAKVLILTSALIIGEGIISTTHAQEKPPTPITQVDKSKETNELGQLLNTPEYRHLRGLNYLFTSPFVRIEQETLEDGSSGIRIVKRGIKDGEYDQIVGHLSIRNGELTANFGAPITEAVPIPLEEADKKKPIIQYLLSKHAIEAAPIAIDDSEIATARQFFAIQPMLPQQRETIPLKDTKPDHNVGMIRYAVDSGEKKIATVGLANCVGVTIYNPETHTGGVAHFDPNQEARGMLNNMLDELGQVDSTKVEVRLIGGWSGYSERTVHYLRQELKSRGFKVTSEDILGENISRSIMLDTATGHVTYLER